MTAMKFMWDIAAYSDALATAIKNIESRMRFSDDESLQHVLDAFQAQQRAIDELWEDVLEEAC